LNPPPWQSLVAVKVFILGIPTTFLARWNCHKESPIKRISQLMTFCVKILKNIFSSKKKKKTSFSFYLNDFLCGGSSFLYKRSHVNHWDPQLLS
jgi:hypothetical protein